jgi:hypothetical protein
MRNCSAARRLCKNFIQSPRITESCACQLSGTLAGSRISLWAAWFSRRESGRCSYARYLLGTTRVAAARCLLFHGRWGGPVGQRHRPPHRARRDTCADGRLRDETLDPALAASRSDEEDASAQGHHAANEHTYPPPKWRPGMSRASY